MSRVCVTGASGAIGTTLRVGLRERGHVVAGLDLRAPDDGDDAVMVGDCADLPTVEGALAGVDAVVHLAGVADESDLATILRSHVVTTATVLEAMRRHGVRRLVYASSNHAVGFTPRETLVDTGVRPRPDTFYGVGKVAAEALISLYGDRHGVEGVCLRIGSFRDRPITRRHLSTWLSPADAVRLVDACLTATDVGFAVVYGISGNTRAWWDLTGAAALGYQPVDDAETYAAEILATAETAEDAAQGARVGGEFATPAYDRSPF